MLTQSPVIRQEWRLDGNNRILYRFSESLTGSSFIQFYSACMDMLIFKPASDQNISLKSLCFIKNAIQYQR